MEKPMAFLCDALYDTVSTHVLNSALRQRESKETCVLLLGYG